MFRKAFYLWLVLAALALMAAKCDDGHGDDDNDSAGDADSDGDTDAEAEACEEVIADCNDDLEDCVLLSDPPHTPCFEERCYCLDDENCLELSGVDCDWLWD